MGLRENNKDHLAELAQPLSATTAVVSTPDEPLRFWTQHPRENHLVDLHVFRDGQNERPGTGNWAGPFSGRAGLIDQLAPALKDQLIGRTKLTAGATDSALRAWWRLMDAIEVESSEAGKPIQKVESVDQLTEIHNRRAHDQGISRIHFGTFLRVVNLVRIALKIAPLHWKAPEEPDRKRHLPPDWQTKEVRWAVRREWFNALDRWTHADDLMNFDGPVEGDRALLLKNCLHFQEAVNRTGRAFPDTVNIYASLTLRMFNLQGLNIDLMRDSFYPNAWDIRAAFHQCLAASGWNPATLVDLDANIPFIQVHPKDPSRYMMTGFKERGKSEQIDVGLWKTQGSPGFIIDALLKRTAPLRKQLKEDLEGVVKTKDKLAQKIELLRQEDAAPEQLDAIRDELEAMVKATVQLQAGIRSPWLYVERGGISWLDKRSFSALASGKGVTRTFLERLIAQLNAKRPSDRQIDPGFQPTDFRDAFASFAWSSSGGSVLHVMKALGHAALRSTKTYLDNTLINEKSQQIYKTFSNALWQEIKVHGRVDPTVIARVTRDGVAVEEERQRLEDYRNLRRSRLGVGCKNPHAPPRSVAPVFVPNGKRMCPSHRCTLCFENAVILPESLDGLCMRAEELLEIQLAVSATAWLESKFPEEVENTDLALRGFDEQEVADHRTLWANRIASGTHRIPDLPVRDPEVKVEK